MVTLALLGVCPGSGTEMVKSYVPAGTSADPSKLIFLPEEFFSVASAKVNPTGFCSEIVGSGLLPPMVS